MKFSAAALAIAAVGASAQYNGTVSIVTEVVTELTTWCPSSTTVTFGSSTYTITEATTLTIPCPGTCTLTKPVTTSKVVSCSTCGSNYTAPAPTKSTPAGTGALPSKSSPGTSVPTAGAGRAAALSGAGLAGLVGLAAFVL